MKEYDVLVIGSGCGMNVINAALHKNNSVALIDKGPLGGTCPNFGCIPSKMLIISADRVTDLDESKKMGITARAAKIDFKFIMERMRKFLSGELSHMKHELELVEELGYFKGEASFVNENTLEINGEKVKGKKIFIATGSRPAKPPVKGLDTVDYLTNESLLQLEESPESLIIIGGGYIAAEYGHFFSAMGTKVTILEMADKLVPAEEPEISELLKAKLGERMGVHTGLAVEEIKAGDNGIIVIAADKKNGQKGEFTAAKILLAAGRVSNADRLNVKNAGIETDARGYIRTNELLETNVKNIYAIGDANGEQLFTHAANRESMIAAHNAMHGSKIKMDYTATPHAVFSHPQIASVGLKEADARQTKKILVGKAKYSDVAQGAAMAEAETFAKVIVEAGSEKILGFHIIGPYAPILIQEVVNVMASGGTINHLDAGMHIHPSISELVPRTLDNLEEA